MLSADLRAFLANRTAAATLLFRRRDGSDVERAPRKRGSRSPTYGVKIMAQRTVQLIIGQILTDEEFRSDFLERPLEILRTLRERGVELTSVENRRTRSNGSPLLGDRGRVGRRAASMLSPGWWRTEVSRKLATKRSRTATAKMLENDPPTRQSFGATSTPSSAHLN